MKQYGLPYQGSKSKIAEKLHAAIYGIFGEVPCFFDLFGGGGAMSDCAAQFKRKNLFEDFEYQKIYYNEIDTAYFAYRWAKENGIGEFKKLWVGREDFFKAVNFDFSKGTEKEKAFASLSKIIYSFGNDQRSYLYAREIEDFKRALFIISTEKDFNVEEVCVLLNSRTFNNEIGVYRQVYDLEKVNDLKRHAVNRRRFALKKCIKERVFESDKGAERVEREERVESVESVQRVESVERVEFSQKNAFDILKNPESYCDPEKTVFYADPPYAGTMGYNGGFNHAEFWDLCREFKYRLIISEYQLDEALGKETRETLTEWIKQQRQ